MPAKTGLRCKLYRNTAATFASPTWTEVELVGDLNMAASWAEATGNTRETWVERTARTFMQLAPTGTMRVVDPGDPTATTSAGHYAAFRNAFHNPDTVIDLLILNGPNNVEGSHGYRAEWEVVNWSENQAVGNVLFKDFGLKPGFTTNKPQHVIVNASNALVYTDLDA